MSTELTPTLNPASIEEVVTLSKYFFESGMFTDIKSAAQAMVKIMAGAEIGLPAFQSMTGIHIISGKPVIGAGLMASRVKASGKYSYKITEQTDKACSIEFYQGKEKLGTSTFTLEDAKKAGTKNLDKFPANMLFARAISNGVRFYCPDVFAGPVYTPEEMQAETIDVPHQELTPKPVASKKTAEPKPIEPERDWEIELKLCSTLAELQQLWAQIPKEKKIDLETLKDQIKNELSNQKATA